MWVCVFLIFTIFLIHIRFCAHTLTHILLYYTITVQSSTQHTHTIVLHITAPSVLCSADIGPTSGQHARLTKCWHSHGYRMGYARCLRQGIQRPDMSTFFRILNLTFFYQGRFLSRYIYIVFSEINAIDANKNKLNTFWSFIYHILCIKYIHL